MNMSIQNIIAEKISLPLSDLALGHSIHKYFEFLQKSQFWSTEQIDEYQNRKLRELIYHAYNHVPFYRELFQENQLKPEDIQTKKDLERLPIITKDDLKKNKHKWLADTLSKKSLILTSSSGSTGEPFQFYKTKHAESFMKATAIRAWYWMGYKLGDKYVKLSMNTRNSKIKKLQDKLNSCKYLSSKQLAKNDFLEIYNKILKYNPKFIRCYPIPLHFLSKIINEDSQTYTNNNLIAINTTGSTLHDNIRADIENVFKVKIYDSYSCEGGAMFAQCPDLTNYHPAQEYAISEFIEDNFTNSNPEKPLRHITTDLHNYATPFIRYDTQDYVVLGNTEKCTCGRNLLNIKQIKGRDSDILITPSGKFLIVENFVAYFEWRYEVDQIQIIQNKIDTIEMNLIVNSNFNNEVLNKIKTYWENYIGNDVKLTIQIVDEISLTPTGKRRTVIRNPEIEI
jgi:phenylacetate-CoA ligase